MSKTWMYWFYLQRDLEYREVELAGDYLEEMGFKLLSRQEDGRDQHREKIHGCRAFVEIDGAEYIHESGRGLDINTDTRFFALINDFNISRTRDCKFEAHVRDVFSRLCHDWPVHYACSLCENTLEEFHDDEMRDLSAFHQHIFDGKVPPILQWMNYFSHEYLENLPSLDVPGLWQPLGNKGDELLYLADYPWNQRIATLEGVHDYMIIDNRHPSAVI